MTATEATGGGYSVLFDQPAWQQLSLPKGLGRGVPDVAYSAAIFHGILIQFLVGHGGGTFLFGGTSCGSPQWSALTAITNQKAGYRLGFLNADIYRIGRGGKAYSASFHDVTTGTNSSGEFDSMGNPVIATGFMAGPSWDATIGLGSPFQGSIADNLIKYFSPTDGQAAISTTNPKPIVPGHMRPN